jgi:selenocysteine lyase/cysteine desulfurase
LSKIPGVKVHTSEDPYLSGGLTAFSIDGVECSRVVDYVREKYNIVVRTIGSKEKGTYAVRVSTPIYISFKEINMFLEGVRELVRHKA